jgi:hypothetical protein
MRKKTPKRKPRTADELLKTSEKRDIELTEKELGKVSGGTWTDLTLRRGAEQSKV